MFWPILNYTLSNTGLTQHKILHSISHSAFNVLNILIGIGHIKAWWSYIIRIIYTFLELHLPECMQPKQSLLPPPINTLHSHIISKPPKDNSAAARNLLHHFPWLHTPTSFSCLCDLCQKLQIFLSPWVYINTVSNYEHVTMSNCEDISHKPYTQKTTFV